MMETIQILGRLGEFVGAMTVLGTLIYISIQVRHGSLLLGANGASAETGNPSVVRLPALAISPSPGCWGARPWGPGGWGQVEMLAKIAAEATVTPHTPEGPHTTACESLSSASSTRSGVSSFPDGPGVPTGA